MAKTFPPWLFFVLPILSLRSRCDIFGRRSSRSPKIKFCQGVIQHFSVYLCTFGPDLILKIFLQTAVALWFLSWHSISVMKSYSFFFFFYIFTVTQTTIDTSNHVPHIWPVTRVSPFLMHNYFIVGSPNHLHIFDGLRTQGVRCHVWQHDKHQQRQQCCNHLIVQNPTIGQSTHNPHNSSYLFSKKKKGKCSSLLVTPGLNYPQISGTFVFSQPVGGKKTFLLCLLVFVELLGEVLLTTRVMTCRNIGSSLSNQQWKLRDHSRKL